MQKFQSTLDCHILTAKSMALDVEEPFVPEEDVETGAFLKTGPIRSPNPSGGGGRISQQLFFRPETPPPSIPECQPLLGSRFDRSSPSPEGRPRLGQERCLCTKPSPSPGAMRPVRNLQTVRHEHMPNHTRTNAPPHTDISTRSSYTYPFTHYPIPTPHSQGCPHANVHASTPLNMQAHPHRETERRRHIHAGILYGLAPADSVEAQNHVISHKHNI